jgi:hypothetical protein
MSPIFDSVSGCSYGYMTELGSNRRQSNDSIAEIKTFVVRHPLRQHTGISRR